MAEEKKPASKDAPKKDEQPWIITFFPVVLIALIFILSAWLGGVTIFDDPMSTIKIQGSQSIFNIYRWIGTGELDEGERVINTNKVTVRNAPAGNVIGNQKKLEVGIIRQGPVSAYNVNWWGVDYKNAPDGWVVENSITTKIGVVRGFNIIPIVYNFYKPIGYVLLIILLIAFIYFKLRLRSEEKISEKKLELKLEAAREKQTPLAVQIEQKPDVQEIPGFQTEEIMPVEQLEKENRWQHIQDLISSYNSSDWRQAIIEADIILEEMLEKMGYDGVTIGDKLKNIERSDFITHDRAWSAHKVRNQIAHDGSNFKLTREVAEKTIKEFEEVFREFYYI